MNIYKIFISVVVIILLICSGIVCVVKIQDKQALQQKENLKCKDYKCDKDSSGPERINNKCVCYKKNNDSDDGGIMIIGDQIYFF